MEFAINPPRPRNRVLKLSSALEATFARKTRRGACRQFALGRASGPCEVLSDNILVGPVLKSLKLRRACPECGIFQLMTLIGGEIAHETGEDKAMILMEAIYTPEAVSQSTSLSVVPADVNMDPAPSQQPVVIHASVAECMVEAALAQVPDAITLVLDLDPIPERTAQIFDEVVQRDVAWQTALDRTFTAKAGAQLIPTPL